MGTDSEQRIAVIDVETTGLRPTTDRVVEVAVVVLKTNGTKTHEFTTLVNPRRDVGPTRIHGIAAADVAGAPTFEGVLGHLAEAIDGCAAIAGHNVRFDRTFVAREFERCLAHFPECWEIDTMRVAGGGTLAACCEEFGVRFDGTKHAALHDARATAALLARFLEDYPSVRTELARAAPIRLPPYPKAPPAPRGTGRAVEVTPSFLARAVARLQRTGGGSDDARLAEYGAMLCRVLEDREVTEAEADALVELAELHQLSVASVQQAHRDFLRHLTAAACADGVVTGVERRDLERVAHLLGLRGVDLGTLIADCTRRIQSARSEVPTGPCELAGKRVCFTGESNYTLHGLPIDKEMTRTIVEEAGLEWKTCVSKKLDILVVADAATQSTKAVKARELGTRIIHESEFWRMLGVRVA